MCLAERSLGTDVQLDARGAEAHGDPDALVQVVQNLLVNARRYAAGSPVWVTATAADGRAGILVCDDGAGIAEAERARVFLRGARGAAAARTAGDGLGLHVAGRLMAASGGHLRLVDGPTRGACFLLELPAPDRPADAACDAALGAPRQNGPTPGRTTRDADNLQVSCPF